jgi:hypothetical protein
MVLVDEQGRVLSDQIHITIKQPPELDVFDAAARAVAARAVFAPALKDGAPNRAWGFVKVEFNIPVDRA